MLSFKCLKITLSLNKFVMRYSRIVHFNKDFLPVDYDDVDTFGKYGVKWYGSYLLCTMCCGTCHADCYCYGVAFVLICLFDFT